ncbi:GNAT family N-acetyltransferase, partial [Escherichia marmotae]|nr:GNAT family N-acetyltransferase [Escherichia marmotae]
MRRLEGEALTAELDSLACVLVDCVEGGASVSFMWPFSRTDA